MLLRTTYAVKISFLLFLQVKQPQRMHCPNVR